ncbi:MAG: hypothetical protein GF331_23080 [Chitinivibrionales bacterium]|nr:hypothetical protein [Chitinivibrionales bacterium]
MLRLACAMRNFAVRFCPECILALLLCSAPAVGAIDGTALATADGRIVRVPVVGSTAGAMDSIFTEAQWGSSWQDHAGIEGPCFSPDGKRIAFVKKDWWGPFGSLTQKIFTIGNDGSLLDTICFCENPQARFVFMSWDDNGYLWWSEQSEKVFRADPRSKERETFAVLQGFSGDWPPNPRRIDALKVSRDGTRAGFMLCGVGYCKSLDFSTLVLRDYGYGCQGTVSPDGQLVTHSALMDGYSGHQVGYIHDFETKAIVDTFFAPGAVPGDSGSLPRIITIRFSHSSNEHIVYRGEDALDGLGFVHDLPGNETVELGACGPTDFWAGALPSADGPFISLDRSLVQFASADQASATQTVAVSNGGSGTLGTLEATVLPSAATWLSATPGPDQVQISIDTTGLSPGCYRATVSVTAASALNTGVCTVVLNHGTALAAPSGLYLGKLWRPASCIGLAWKDNADNEDGFVIERRYDGESWQVVDTVAPDVTSYMDTVRWVGVFTYRVRCFAGTDWSGYSNEATLRTWFEPSITVLSPDSCDTLTVGDTVRVRWITDGVTNVEIKYSVDDGEHWLNVTSSASVTTDSSAWGNYPWVVPDLDQDSVRIMVHAYSDQGLAGLSGYFAVKPPSAVSPVTCRMPFHTKLRTPAASALRGTVRFRYELAEGARGFLAVYQLNGTRVARLPLARTTGTHELVWRYGGAGDGFFLARLEVE